ncbi:MAG: hypothetical protein ACRC4M_00520 [Mycoplasma sp.]
MDKNKQVMELMSTDELMEYLKYKVEKADRSPCRDEVILTGKFLRYNDNKNYVTTRMNRKFGAYYETMPSREEVTNKMIQEETFYKNANDMRQENAQRRNDENTPLMAVPQNDFDMWARTCPHLTYDEYIAKKKFLDEYLETVDPKHRENTKRIMCEEESINYVSFLDRDPENMNSAQRRVFEEINAYNDTLIAENIDTQDKLVSTYVDTKRKIDENYDTTKNQQIESGFLRQETSSRTNTQNHSQVIGQQHQQHSNFVSTPIEQQTQQISNEQQEQQAFNQNLQQHELPVVERMQSIPTTNIRNIFNVPNCNSIEGLIKARKEVEENNREIIHDMVVNQISLNNTFTHHNQTAAPEVVNEVPVVGLRR